MKKPPESELSGQQPLSIDQEKASLDRPARDISQEPVPNTPDESPKYHLVCPQCRAEHNLIEPNGVDGFLTDYVIENQLQERSCVASGSSSSILCDACGEISGTVVAYCSDCGEYLCDFCFKAHKKQLKKFSGHNVKELAELDKEMTIVRKPRRKYHVCPQHPVETIQLYCQSCDTTVCNKCIISCAHNGHDLIEINSQTKEKVYKELFSLSEKVDEDLKLQLKNLEYVKKVEKVTNDMVTSVPQEINNAFDSYISALGKKRKELLADCESKCNKKMKMLWSEKDSLESVVADMTTTQNFTKRLKTCENSKEFLLLASQALPRLKKLESWKWNDGVVEEIERYSLDFHFRKSDEESVKNELGVSVSRLDEDQSLYKVDFQGFSNVVSLGKKHSFTIHISKRKGCGPWVSINTPTVHLWHVENRNADVADLLVTSVERPASFESMEDEKKWENSNCWTVTFTPYCGGRHTLTIKIENTSTHDKEIFVSGRPPIDSKVVPGPNYDSSPDCKPLNGTVVEYRDSLDMIKVRYRQKSEYGRRRNYTVSSDFLWGRNGRYKIQLDRPLCFSFSFFKSNIAI